MIVFAAIVPHPLESIPEVGTAGDERRIKKTLLAFEQLRVGLEEAAPDTIIIISPHAKIESFAFVINAAKKLVGTFAQFGLEKSFEYQNDIQLVHEIKHFCRVNEVSAHTHHDPLDYGTLIPLYHLTKNINPKIVQLSFSMMSYQQHFRYGQVIESVIGKKSSKRIAIIASGDLSHRLIPGAPAGYSPAAEVFDRTVIHHLGENNFLSILDMHKEDIDEVAECGVRSILILLGALHEEKYAFKLLSYEGPFGIGYMVARLI